VVTLVYRFGYGTAGYLANFALRVGLLLYHRLSWLRGGYRVCVPMHHLPGAIFGSKGHRNPQIAWGDLLCSADLRIGPLYPEDGGKLRGYVLRYGLEVIDLAISEYGCSTIMGLGNLLPSKCGRPKGVCERYVVFMGEEVLHGLGVPFDELLARLLELFEYSVEIIYSSHLEVTSIVDVLLSLRTLCGYPTLFTQVPRETVRKVS
jgi:hypothetical protein